MQVFDLAANKVEPLSKQKIHATAGLTRLAFNAHYPILLVGDDRCVQSLLALLALHLLAIHITLFSYIRTRPWSSTASDAISVRSLEPPHLDGL